MSEMKPTLQAAQPSHNTEVIMVDRAFLERMLYAMEGVIDVADRQTDEFGALRSCIVDLTLMLFKPEALRASHGQAPAGAAPDPVAYLYDDGSWTPAKTEEGRKLSNWMISAGSPKIGVLLASAAQPTRAAQATQTGNQREARPCHVFTVRKAGAVTEWEPTSMAFALADGAHALYTLPRPAPTAHPAPGANVEVKK